MTEKSGTLEWGHPGSRKDEADVVKEFCTPQLSCFVTIQPILPWPTRLGLMHLHEIRFFALKKQ
ncbi:MAG: hypothetical protein KZQ66_14845, partial [Candidatus Thiodiazotropha sp. (ex Lucinoma aequizonata)]|nr:hypothetical protein [Candidatus Thiodiazotropha sp. (ex Lucinoma aequizonata)]MCU7889152.1 hypothetical protein [Candidatus Thiodiazotropha sp. (ex Lucinoma aequizonata)]MCU7898175.1 hypothetical protein [Candidatus Thiodiazotropha sp. (ex Lucinoma aequizonata)]MCU7903114.1 hypothetical protein [Candidatus Thiodiazotropha sp. (ex Lucinoma aequizonata)]